MNETLIGIAVGVAVALMSQLIAYVFDLIKRNREEKRLARAVIRLLLQELATHLALYKHHLKGAEQSIQESGEEHTGYSYQPLLTDVHDKVFLPNWHVLKSDVVQTVTEYYATLRPVNLLSGSFGQPTPVPIKQAKEALERAQASAKNLHPLLQRQLPREKEK